MIKSKILVIDDEDQLRKALSRILELEGYQVYQAVNGSSGLKILGQEKEIDLVICDVKLPDINGIQVLENIKTHGFDCEVILITAYGTIHDGVHAMKIGAFDYITKGDQDEHIVVTVEKAIEKARLKKRIYELEDKLETRYSFDRILGNSQAIKSVKDMAHKVSPTDSTVLLLGETGTGKELFAQSIHNGSRRKDKSFVAINCSAFPKELLEAEMFGYKRGSFTGAISDKNGFFSEAHEGTLFLDEVSEMPHDLQAKLLRVLEEQTFTRIGETKPVKVNVRIIAATNKDLMKEMEADRFRQDLYYRLSVFNIKLPSLRERIEDIRELTDFFIKQYSLKTKKKINGATPEFYEILKKNSWPGNTRELKNIIERAVILCDEEILIPALLPNEIKTLGKRSFISESDLIDDLEKNHIRNVLDKCGWNKTRAAEKLGIGIPTLYRKIDQYGLER
ncbi:MAG: sigma-54-dependent Fis family transcriptional regulator [Bacteroidetes bacterium GWF2_38_335]|nr:MAG: sigma-54-dependent Fis family transcriptional regulator [Bacteroidetes bacterium GWF2_38_335]OFY81620.1 MAG: sigma-54-dependent Fis family transcriptional regulator [Bacteroidetes bacterium RIFOXYA12_FULL_38_20]HBS88972.1 sigma-54-dependent Fis family transcriptional regulator [Bacteroidales bacterium]